MNVRAAGMKLKLKNLRTTVPKAMRPPKTFTGIMSMNTRTRNPAAVARAVYFTGLATAAMVAIIAAFLSPVSRTLNWNSLNMWMLSVAMAMRKTGAMELMMCTGNPRPMRSPMLQTMLIIAAPIMHMASGTLLNMI